jgi:hypothetical protein
VEDEGVDELRGTLRDVEIVRLKKSIFGDVVQISALLSCERSVEEVKLIH